MTSDHPQRPTRTPVVDDEVRKVKLIETLVQVQRYATISVGNRTKRWRWRWMSNPTRSCST